MDLIRIKKGLLEPNTGQVEGLPKNPRKWTSAEVEKLKVSIEQTPELLEIRPIIVVKNKEKFVVLGGNLRFEACKRIKEYQELPCYVLEDMPVQKMKEIVLKDNSSFGNWDVDELANFWDSLPLDQWGVNVAIDTEEDYSGKNTEINTDEWSEDQTLKLKFDAEQMAFVRSRLKDVDPRTEILRLLDYGKD